MKAACACPLFPPSPLPPAAALAELADPPPPTAPPPSPPSAPLTAEFGLLNADSNELVFDVLLLLLPCPMVPPAPVRLPVFAGSVNPAICCWDCEAPALVLPLLLVLLLLFRYAIPCTNLKASRKADLRLASRVVFCAIQRFHRLAKPVTATDSLSADLARRRTAPASRSSSGYQSTALYTRIEGTGSISSSQSPKS